MVTPASMSHGPSGQQLGTVLVPSSPLPPPPAVLPPLYCKADSRYISFLDIIFNQNVIFNFHFKLVCLKLIVFPPILFFSHVMIAP